MGVAALELVGVELAGVDDDAEVEEVEDFEEPPHPATISAMTEAATATRESRPAPCARGCAFRARRIPEAVEELMSMVTEPLSVVVYGPPTGDSTAPI